MLALSACLLTACNLFKQDCARPQVFCAGLVTDTGGLQDFGPVQSAWEDVQRARADGLVQSADYIESVDTRDYAKNLEFFAQQKYDLILGTGAGMRDETLQAARLRPDSVFVGLDQLPDDSLPNFISLTFPEDQAGFLAGALAARMTATRIVAAACESSDLASNWRTCEGFRAGARHTDPEVQVHVVYRDNGSSEDLFRDRDWGYATAADLIRGGADVVFGVGGGTGQGALLGAAEAGVYAIGSEQDQFYVTRDAQPVLLSSLVKRASPAVYDLISLLRDGGLHESTYPGSFALAPFHSLEQRVPADLRAYLDELQQDLSTGVIATGVESERPK